MKHLLVFLFVVSAFTATSSGQTADSSKTLPLFAVLYTTGHAWDTTKSPNEQTAMRDHSALMQKLRKEGTTVLGGRYSDKGLLIMRASTESELLSTLSTDPSVQAGTMKFELFPFSPFYEGCVGKK